MGASKTIKKVMKINKTKQLELAELLGIEKRALEQRFYRDMFYAEDLLKIAATFGYKLAFIKEGEQIIFNDNDD